MQILQRFIVSLSRQVKRCGSSSVGRVLASQAEGHGFESRLPLVSNKGISRIWFMDHQNDQHVFQIIPFIDSHK